MANTRIGRRVVIACVAALLIGGALLLGMVWEWSWNLF
jgi:hypothetical protein